jgi:hypothetical protein
MNGSSFSSLVGKKRTLTESNESASTTNVASAPGGQTDTEKNTNGLSDNENSEDDEVEHAPWQDIDLNPAIDLLNKVISASLDAGKTYNKSVISKTTQLITGLDHVLLEIKNISDAREAARKNFKQNQQDSGCSCNLAVSMLPGMSGSTLTSSNDPKKDGNSLDEITEDQTDRVLYKVEASMERLRDMAEMIQATSMQGEANLIAKVKLPEEAIKSMGAAIQSAAATATATAIAQERGRSSSAFSRLYSPMQVKKLQEWYYSYPRPLLDELTLMRTILNYRPYANPFHVNGLSIAHVRDWFKRRRYRERVRYVKLAIEADQDPVAAEEEIELRIEQRIERLRGTISPNELVKELDKVRAESSMYDTVATSFARSGNLDSYIAASYTVPAVCDLLGPANGRSKRSKTQDMDVDEAIVVKVGSRAEVSALQNRIRSLLSLPRSASNTNSIQQAVDLLRSFDIARDVRVETNVVADLKKILKVYKKPTLLRKTTIALIETLGIDRRPTIVLSQDASKTSADAESIKPEGTTLDKTSTPVKKDKGKVHRPMKFNMKQVVALEGWFQKKYKPTQSEMEEYLTHLNAPPLRGEKQTVEVNMTQLRRWFNKRRCLGRPPFSLINQQEEERKQDGEEEEIGNDGNNTENDTSKEEEAVKISSSSTNKTSSNVNNNSKEENDQQTDENDETGDDDDVALSHQEEDMDEEDDGHDPGSSAE